jgi:L-alanine-DL-glutamate epimerase-like enolase superfamily enzyme
VKKEMKITKIKISSLEIPMKKTVKTSRAQQNVAKHVIVQILTSNGLVGIGEGAPRPHITGENLDSVFLTIEKYIGPVLIGEDPLNMQIIHKKMDRASELNTTAKCAIDLALYDVIGKSFGVPVYDLLGGKTKDALHINGTCDINEPELVSKILKKRVKEGFTHSIKIKVGTDPLKDIERVRVAREAIGPEIDLIADANQGWNVPTAIRTLRKMENFDLQIAEQPVYWEDLRGLAEVTRSVRLSIMADESVWSPFDAMQIIQMKAAHMLNIKLIKSGGLYNAQKIASLAQAANMDCMVGCTVETSILNAAEGHLAMALENIKYIDQWAPPEFLIEDPAQGIKWKKDLLILPDKPGLGVELDEKVFEKYKTCESLIG